MRGAASTDSEVETKPLALTWGIVSGLVAILIVIGERRVSAGQWSWLPLSYLPLTALGHSMVASWYRVPGPWRGYPLTSLAASAGIVIVPGLTYTTVVRMADATMGSLLVIFAFLLVPTVVIMVPALAWRDREERSRMMLGGVAAIVGAFGTFLIMLPFPDRPYFPQRLVMLVVMAAVHGAILGYVAESNRAVGAQASDAS